MESTPVVEAAPEVQAAPAPVMVAPVMEPIQTIAPAPMAAPGIAAPLPAAPAIPSILMQIYGPPQMQYVPSQRQGCMRCLRR